MRGGGRKERGRAKLSLAYRPPPAHRFLRLALPPQEHVHQHGRGALPEGITPIHQLVRPALEAALHLHLPSGHPPLQRHQVRLLCPPQDHQRSKGTKHIPAMRLLPRLAAKPAFVSLAGQEVVGHARGEFRGKEVEEGSDGDNRVGAADVYFSVRKDREGREGREEGRG